MSFLPHLRTCARALRVALLLALTLGFSRASAQDPSVDDLRSIVPDSARTHVLILGTPHLSGIETPFDPSALDPLLDALVRFEPDVILVEAYAARDVERLALVSDREPNGVASQIAQARASLGVMSGRAAQTELGLTSSQARAEADSMLTLHALSPAERHRTALLFLAAHDVWSALLHWVQVPMPLRGETDPAQLGPRYPDWTATDALNYVAATNETELLAIGVEVARRVGVGRVLGFDGLAEVEAEAELGYFPRLRAEVASDSVYIQVQERARAFGQSIQARQESAAATGDFVGLYLYMNSDEYARSAAEVERVWLRTEAPSGLDRARWALWETRNLEMATHLRRASAFHAGGRVLAIVGASHKQYLESVLKTLADIEVVEFSRVVQPDSP